MSGKMFDNFLQQRARLLCSVALLLGLFLSLCSLAQESTRKVVTKTAPSYPELAKKMHLSGTVKIEVVVNPAGAVTSAKLVGGSPIFEANAVDAVKQWKFEPASGQTKGIVLLDFTEH